MHAEPGIVDGAIAEAIVRLIEHPVAEIYTNPKSAEVARRYFEDVGAFEAHWVSGR